MTLQESTGPTMNRHGKKRRKRSTSSRTATGRVRQPAVDYRSLAAAQPHRNWIPEAYRLDERAGTVLGSLNIVWRVHEARKANDRLLKKPVVEAPSPGISDDQYEAGRRYAVIFGQYLASVDAPRSIAGTGRGYPCFGLGCPPEYCECLMRRNRYMRAYEAIPDRLAHVAINLVVIDDEIVSPAQVEHLVRGLRMLVRHFGIHK